MARSAKQTAWVKLLKEIQTPLGFFVLALLIIESTLSLVLTLADLQQPYRWYGFLWMIGIFVFVILIVAILVYRVPKNLTFGKEEHAATRVEPSALRDQIEDIIYQRVKSECLKTDKDEVN